MISCSRTVCYLFLLRYFHHLNAFPGRKFVFAREASFLVAEKSQFTNMRYLLIMAGLGGLLYGVDVGVIAAALPYIEQTAGFNPSQLSQVVAAVLFGSVLSSLFAGYLADKMGRKALITVAAALFTASIPVICLRRFACRQLCGRRREFRRERRIADFRQGSGLAGYFLGLRHSRPVPVFRFLPFERISPLPVPPRPQG